MAAHTQSVGAEAPNLQTLLQVGGFSPDKVASKNEENDQAALTFRRQACNRGSV